MMFKKASVNSRRTSLIYFCTVRDFFIVFIFLLAHS